MSKKYILLLALYFYIGQAHSQIIIFINAGSRANYGNQQELSIDREGNARYILRKVNGAAEDSLYFTLTSQQVDSIFRKANSVGFFNLNAKYQSATADGSGLHISLNHNGRIHTVQLFNTDIKPINDLITFLNTMLAPRGIRINYGQFAPKRPQ